MAHPSDKRDTVDPLAEDDLGRMIRWGLEESFAEAEPPHDVWPKIRLRVQEMRAAAHRTPVNRRRSFSLAPLVQTVVASVLLLSLVLGVDRNQTAPRGELTVRSTPTAPRMVSGEELPNDMLSGYLLARMAQQSVLRQRPGGVRP